MVIAHMLCGLLYFTCCCADYASMRLAANMVSMPGIKIMFQLNAEQASLYLLIAWAAGDYTNWISTVLKIKDHAVCNILIVSGWRVTSVLFDSPIDNTIKDQTGRP